MGQSVYDNGEPHRLPPYTNYDGNIRKCGHAPNWVGGRFSSVKVVLIINIETHFVFTRHAFPLILMANIR